MPLTAESPGGANDVRVVGGDIVAGGLGQQAIQIAAAGGGRKDGTVAFASASTIRLWGGERVDGNLTLICGGK